MPYIRDVKHMAEFDPQNHMVLQVGSGQQNNFILPACKLVVYQSWGHALLQNLGSLDPNGQDHLTRPPHPPSSALLPRDRLVPSTPTTA